jgi:photosystem II stability/assembly factor-like uncharacterized protein
MILHTTDNGATWSQQPLPGTPAVVALACPTASTCFVLSNAFPNPTVLKVTAASTTSENLPTEVGGGNALSCASANVCLVGGYDSSQTGGGILVATTDGGLSWAPQTLPTGAVNVAVMAITCPASSVCRAVGDGDNNSTVLTGRPVGPPAAPPPSVTRNLPRTGGETFFPIMLGLWCLATGALLVRGRRQGGSIRGQ